MSEYKIMNKHPTIARGPDGAIEACAQFDYKGYEISISTMGRYSGACRTPVAVFKAGGVTREDLIGEFHTPEDAIKWIDGDDSVTDYMGKPVERKGGEDHIEMLRRTSGFSTKSALDIYREYPDPSHCSNKLLEYARKLEYRLYGQQ
jgi:hypothetical protein